MNDHENTTYENLWDAAEAMLRENFIALDAYIRRMYKSIIYVSTLLSKLRKVKKIKPK